ncbi:MAG: hypothetical protein PHP54_04080 [Clostridia bacterium]|nr:hypothetical protein [Clostridia bacterium]
MLSYEVYNYYLFINNKLEELEEVFKIAFDWIESYNSTCKEVLNKVLTAKASAASDGTHYVVPNGGLVKKFDETMEVLQKSFNVISVTIKYGEIKKEIETYKIKNKIKTDYIENFFEYTDNMLQIYQEWIQNLNDKEYAIRLGKQFVKYERFFVTCKNVYNNFLDLYTDNEGVDSKKAIDIQLLDVELDLEEFNSVLNSINKIYYELGNIMYPNIGGMKYEKLKIVKIESGSIWSKLFGDENILSVFANFLNKTVDFIFNKFTIEGKLSRQQVINSSIKESLEMYETLKNMGYNVNDSNEDIQKAFLCSTKHLLNIASKSAKIRVNDQMHELNGDVKIKYLEENKRMLLSDGNESDNEVKE